MQGRKTRESARQVAVTVLTWPYEEFPCYCSSSIRCVGLDTPSTYRTPFQPERVDRYYYPLIRITVVRLFALNTNWISLSFLVSNGLPKEEPRKTTLITECCHVLLIAS